MNNERVFRRDKTVTLVIPGLPRFATALLVTSVALYLASYTFLWLWLLLFTLFPVFSLLQLYLDWLSYSVVAVAGSNVLTERSGIFTVRERLIPMANFLPVEYERPKWALWLGLDFGHIRISAMGGPFLLRAMGDFADLWRVLESRGEDVPPERPSVLSALPGWLWRFAEGIARGSLAALGSLVPAPDAVRQSARGWLRRAARGAQADGCHMQPAPGRTLPIHDFEATAAPLCEARQRVAEQRQVIADGGYVYKGTPFSPHDTSLAGLYAFCETFILARNWTRWVYHASDSGRMYYPKGISEWVARYYLEHLRQKSILIPINGHERLSSRIRSVRDIQRLIPELPGPVGRVA